MAYTRTMNGKVPQVLQELHFDETPTPDSLNPVTSGGVAESVARQSSNLAPEYTKKTYEANSYVMHDGVLYTNPSAIGTAEDWNPAHWTQTTVAEMMAGAGGTKWTQRKESVNVVGGQTERLDVQDHEFVYLTTKRTDSSGIAFLDIHLHGECYIFLNKGSNVLVRTYVNDSTSLLTTNTITGLPKLNASITPVLSLASSGIPAEYDPSDFSWAYVLDEDTTLDIERPSTLQIESMYALLHYFGEGTLIVTPLPE